MSATLAPSPWPHVPRSPRVFGQRVVLGDAGQPGEAVQWLFKRNCSISPRQLGVVYASLWVVSLIIGGVFMWHGAPLVAAFAGLELVAVGLAMLVFARHAADRETLTLVGGSLLVEQWHGSHVIRTDLASDWLTVEPAGGQGSLVQLRGRGRIVRVGRHLRPEWRAAFAQELRQALRQAPVAGGLAAQPQIDTN